MVVIEIWQDLYLSIVFENVKKMDIDNLIVVVSNCEHAFL